MVIVEALVIEMTFEIAVLALERKKAFDRLNIGKVLICRGDDTTIRTTFHRGFDILEQQDKASLFDKADRERKRPASAQVVLYFIEECYLGVVG